MILDLLIPKLQQRLPGRGFRIVTTTKPSVIFPAAHPEVGDIVIEDHGGELILYAGNITHGHYSNYDEKLSLEQKAERIDEDVVRFLEALFADRVILWGSQRGGGGWHYRDVPPRIPPELESLLKMDSAKRYVWSGPLSG